MRDTQKIACIIFTFITYFFSTGYVQALGHEGFIERVVDGDTLHAKIDGQTYRIRLLCIDAPEKESNQKSLKDAARLHEDENLMIKAGKKSNQYVRSLLHEGDAIHLDYDKDLYDQYGRILAYVYLKDKTFLNEKLIKDGYAGVLCYAPNDSFAERFMKDLESASRSKRGLWADGITLQNKWIKAH